MVYKERDKLIAQARKLRKEGMSYQKIADEIGATSDSTVRYWLDPSARKYCREERREYNKQYRKAHKEESRKYREARKEKDRKYREARKEEKREYDKQYRGAHKEESRKYYEARKEEKREYYKQYRKAHKEESRKYRNQYYAANKHRCRAAALRRRGFAGDGIDQEQFAALFEAQEGLCAYCKKELLTKGNHLRPDYCNIEHVYPLSREGVDELENIVLACRKCNSEKGTKTIEEWRPALLAKIGNGVRSKE